MAATVSLVRRADYTAPASDVSSVSLLAYTDGFNLDYYGGWAQGIAEGMEPGNVFETLGLIVKAVSHDYLAVATGKLDQKMREVAQYWDGSAERYGVWLRTQLANESGARQSIIRRMRGTIGESVFGPYTDVGNVMRRYTLGIERLPWWEETTTDSLYSASPPLTVDGDMQALNRAASGDVSARIAATSLLVTAGDELDEVWAGFHGARYGTANNFVPKWQTGLGTTVSADTTDEGDWMSCDFSSSEDMITRFYVEVQDVTANYADQRGEFVVLLRARKTAGTTECYVRLLDGYSSTDSELRQQDRVRIRRTDWMLHPLGTITIPPAGGIPADSIYKTYRLAVQAERTAGAGDLYFDYFILIPTAYGALHIGDMAMTAGETAQVYVRPDDVAVGFTYAAGGVTDIEKSLAVSPLGPYGYSLPQDAGYIVLAGQRATEHDETDSVTYTANFYNRYRTLRGTGV